MYATKVTKTRRSSMQQWERGIRVESMHKLKEGIMQECIQQAKRKESSDKSMKKLGNNLYRKSRKEIRNNVQV